MYLLAIMGLMVRYRNSIMVEYIWRNRVITKIINSIYMILIVNMQDSIGT